MVKHTQTIRRQIGTTKNEKISSKYIGKLKPKVYQAFPMEIKIDQ